ncbi:MAG TPA: hypothetical protein VM870_00375 [Pyrinomonadaceae bacterium]|nr:hypothetical protein [Pyrinomonadaceae bacterium]
MNRLTENKIVLVTRRTRLDELIAKFNTAGQAKFYVEHAGADFADYEREHKAYQTAVEEATAALGRLGRLQTIDRAFLPNFVFGAEDTIVVLGQDGLVANTVKYLAGQLVVGVNPDSARWDGVLLPFAVGDLPRVVPEVFAGRRPVKEVTRAEARLGDGQTLCAVNDLFIGPRSHVSARYRLRVGSQEERQSSSGVIVSTGLGSTGWLKSLLTGATAITNALTGRKAEADVAGRPTAWDARHLYFTVREPFPSKTSAASLVFGRVTADEPLVIQSEMPEHGVIFSDGIEADFLEFNSGACATIRPAERKGRLVV